MLVEFAYVDDCNLIQSGVDPDTVLNPMKALINSWRLLMEVPGGALSIHKSWWYLVEHIWKRKK